MRTSGLLLTEFALALYAAPSAAQDERRGAPPTGSPAAVLPDTTVVAPRFRPRPGEQEQVELSPYGNPGLARPTARAAFNTGWAFGMRSNLAGNPAAAAQAIMEMEFLAVEMQANPEYIQGRAKLWFLFHQAKKEWRAALGLPADAPAQPVVDALRRAMDTLAGGRGPESLAHLPPDLFTLGPAETWRRLNALPSLPRSNFAAVETAQLMRRPRVY